MASVRVKFRPSTQERKEGRIYYQVIHNCIVRQIRTNYGIFMQEWNSDLSQINTNNTHNNERLDYLVSVIEHIKQDIKRLEVLSGNRKINRRHTRLIISFPFFRSSQVNIFLLFYAENH